MNINEFLKLELSGWKKYEIISLFFVVCFILVNAYVLKDNLIAIVSAISGILYTIIAGKGKIFCYLFGFISILCYSFLSYKNGLYGNLLLNICYYFPMQIIGVLAWKNNLKKTTNDIIKTSLKKYEFIKLLCLTLIICICVNFVLSYLGDKSPIIDSTTTVMSLLGMYLTVKRCIEQWTVWIIVNGLSIIMWLNLFVNGAKTFSTVIMWSVYFILGIYFYFEWKKEVKN